MRVNNLVREQISRRIDAQASAAIDALYTDSRAQEKEMYKHLDAIRAAANKQAAAVIAEYGAVLKYNAEHYFSSTAYAIIPDNQERINKVQAIQSKAQELKEETEIRCMLEKDADSFFQMLANLKLDV